MRVPVPAPEVQARPPPGQFAARETLPSPRLQGSGSPATRAPCTLGRLCSSPAQVPGCECPPQSRPKTSLAMPWARELRTFACIQPRRSFVALGIEVRRAW